MKNLDKEIKRLEHEDAWEDSDEIVEVKVKKPLDKVVPIRLSSGDWDNLYQQANELGLGPTTLARMWILEHLKPKSFSNQDLFAIYNMMLFMKVLERNPKAAEDYSDLTTIIRDISANEHKTTNSTDYWQRIKNILKKAIEQEMKENTGLNRSKANLKK
jgi:predicted DNA binding CopG/RHH family protein